MKYLTTRKSHFTKYMTEFMQNLSCLTP